MCSRHFLTCRKYFFCPGKSVLLKPEIFRITTKSSDNAVIATVTENLATQEKRKEDMKFLYYFIAAWISNIVCV
jgi:hypothetical protein